MKARAAPGAMPCAAKRSIVWLRVVVIVEQPRAELEPRVGHAAQDCAHASITPALNFASRLNDANTMRPSPAYVGRRRLGRRRVAEAAGTAGARGVRYSAASNLAASASASLIHASIAGIAVVSNQSSHDTCTGATRCATTASGSRSNGRRDRSAHRARARAVAAAAPRRRAPSRSNHSSASARKRAVASSRRLAARSADAGDGCGRTRQAGRSGSSRRDLRAKRGDSQPMRSAPSAESRRAATT